MKRKALYTLIILSFALWLAACVSDSEKAMRLKPLRQLVAETPVHPSFKEIGASQMVKSHSGSLTYNYRSDAGYVEVKSFYARELSARGWGGPQEQTQATGMKDIIFSKGDYLIIVTDGRAATSDWDYVVYYRWEDP